MSSNITYHGFANYEGRPCVVVVVDGETPQGELQGGPFSWGKGRDEDKANPTARAAVATGGRNLALALCTHLLNGRDDMAHVVMTRFQHRQITNLTTGKDFMLRRADLLGALQQIVETSAGNEEIAKKVAMERGPVEFEGGIGPGGTAFSEIEKRSGGGQPGIPVSKLKDEDL